MSFFNQVFQKIFSEENTADKPFSVKEVLKRSKYDEEDYLYWQKERLYEIFVELLQRTYYSKETGYKSFVLMESFSGKGANCLVIFYDIFFDGKNFQYTFDYLKDKILALDYQLKNAERVITDRDSFVETRERYYLKPSIRLPLVDEKLSNQLYGNISLEYLIKDNQAEYIKVLVTHYEDRKFTKVLDFEDLMEYLFSY